MQGILPIHVALASSARRCNYRSMGKRMLAWDERVVERTWNEFFSILISYVQSGRFPVDGVVIFTFLLFEQSIFYAAMPMTPHAGRVPALPVFLDSSFPPFPRSSVPE